MRPATTEDADALAALVHDAYQHYVERIGREPGPMTNDYRDVIEVRQVTVAEDGEGIAGLIVVGCQGRGKLGSVLLGSVSTQVSAEADRPLVVLPSEARVGSGSGHYEVAARSAPGA